MENSWFIHDVSCLLNGHEQVSEEAGTGRTMWANKGYDGQSSLTDFCLGAKWMELWVWEVCGGKWNQTHPCILTVKRSTSLEKANQCFC